MKTSAKRLLDKIGEKLNLPVEVAPDGIKYECHHCSIVKKFEEPSLKLYYGLASKDNEYFYEHSWCVSGDLIIECANPNVVPVSYFGFEVNTNAKFNAAYSAKVRKDYGVNFEETR